MPGRNFLPPPIGQIKRPLWPTPGFALQRSRFSHRQIALLLVTTGLTIAVMQATLVERTVKTFGEKPLALASLIGQALGNVLIVLAPLFWLLYPLGVLTSAIGGFIWGTMGALIANRVETHEQGLLAGVNTALASLMGILGPLWAGVIYEHVAIGSPYWLGAIVFLLAAALLLRQGKQPQVMLKGFDQQTQEL